MMFPFQVFGSEGSQRRQIEVWRQTKALNASGL